MKSRLPSLALLTVLTIGLPNISIAQTANLQGKSLDQYPSFIQVKGMAATGSNNTEFVLRCGYAVTGGKAAADSTLNDLSLLNASTQTYTRFQNIAGHPVSTSPNPAVAGGQSVIVQVAEADGTVKAKICQANMSTDTVSNCVTTAPVMTAAQIKTQTDGVEKQCNSFIASASVDPSVFSASQTADYKEKLSNKLMLVEAP